MQLLSTLADIQAGHPFRGSIPPADDGNAWALQMRDLDPHDTEGGVNWSGLVRTRIDNRNPQWLQAGDIVFVARGARNYALCLQDVPVPAVCSQYFFLLRVKHHALLPEFLAWQINCVPAQRYLASNAEGSAQLSIRRGVLESLPIAVPSLEKQRLIIKLVATARRERQQLQAMMDNRQRQIEALAHALHDAP